MKIFFYRPLKANHEINEILDNEYREYFHLKKIKSKQNVKLPENAEPNVHISTTSNVTRVGFCLLKFQ